MGGAGQAVPTVPGVPGIIVGGVPAVAGIPGMTVGGMPGPPGITVSGVPGVPAEPGITVSGEPGVPGVGTHRVDDLDGVICSGLDRRTAAATEPDSSDSGVCSSISIGAPLSRRTSLREFTST